MPILLYIWSSIWYYIQNRFVSETNKQVLKTRGRIKHRFFFIFWSGRPDLPKNKIWFLLRARVCVWGGGVGLWVPCKCLKFLKIIRRVTLFLLICCNKTKLEAAPFLVDACQRWKHFRWDFEKYTKFLSFNLEYSFYMLF